jgi:hypothetical protein
LDNANIVITFSKPLEASSVNVLTIELVSFGPNHKESKVEGRVEISADGRKVLFDPWLPLSLDTYYEIHAKGVKDLDGNPNVTPIYPIWSFTTRGW